MKTSKLGIEEYLDHCFAKFIAPLLDQLQLRVARKQVDGIGALYQLAGEALMVRLINDRGFTDLSIAPAHEPEDYWDLQLVDTLFREPPTRGWRAPTLEEQASRLRDSWAELNEMFLPENFAATRSRLQTLGEERAKRLFGRNAV